MTVHIGSARLLTLTLAFVVSVLAASAGWATHDEPGRGKSIKAAFVTSYEPCTAPNTSTQGGFSVPACAPPVRTDPVCGFGAIDGMVGVGKAKGVVHDGDVDLFASLSHLGLGCEGQRLCGVIRVRVTTDRCPEGSCTTTDLLLTNESPTACCQVNQGNCRIRTTINTEIFDALRNGQRAGIQLIGCGLRRVDGPTPPPADKTSFSCGMLSP